MLMQLQTFPFLHCVCLFDLFTTACEKSCSLLDVFGLGGMDQTQAQFKGKGGKKKVIFCLIFLCVDLLFAIKVRIFNSDGASILVYADDTIISTHGRCAEQLVVV